MAEREKVRKLSKGLFEAKPYFFEDDYVYRVLSKFVVAGSVSGRNDLDELIRSADVNVYENTVQFRYAKLVRTKPKEKEQSRHLQIYASRQEDTISGFRLDYYVSELDSDLELHFWSKRKRLEEASGWMKVANRNGWNDLNFGIDEGKVRLSMKGSDIGVARARHLYSVLETALAESTQMVTDGLSVLGKDRVIRI